MKKSVFFILFLFTLLIFVSSTFAGYKPPFGGEYLHVCGSGVKADVYDCSAKCDLTKGFCTAGENQTIYAFVCDRKGLSVICVGDENLVAQGGPGTTFYVTSFAPVGSNKVVQLDVVNNPPCYANGNFKNCRSEQWAGSFSWYSGQPTVFLPQVITLPPVVSL